MTDRSDLPREVVDLIHSSVPDMDALEVLIFLARHPGRSWRARDLLVAMAPTHIREQAAGEALGALTGHGLLAREADGRYIYRPATAALDAATTGLLQAYNERPVTLIRTLYAIADAKRIQAFADAFRIRKES